MSATTTREPPHTSELEDRWAACQQELRDERIPFVVLWRGGEAQFWQRLRDQGWIGQSNGLCAIPVRDRDGTLVSLHCRGDNGAWYYDPPGHCVHPLIIGTVATAKTAFISESPWDLFAAMRMLGWHEGRCDETAFISTRGAGNAGLVAGLLPATTQVFLLPQNDPAGQNWKDGVKAALGDVPNRAVITPLPHKDLNDWMKAGCTQEDFRNAIEGAQSFNSANCAKVPPGAALGACPPNGDSANSANVSPGAPGNASREGWESPILFDCPNLPSFPVGSYPPWLQNQVEAVSVATQTPVDLPGSFSIAVLSLASAKLAKVQVRRGWQEPLQTFTITVLPSGNRKTAVVGEMAAPVLKFEQEQISAMTGQYRQARARREQLKLEVERARRAAAGAKPEEKESRSRYAEELSMQLDATPEPVLPRLLVDDCTVEKMGSHLMEQGGRIAFLSAEGGVFDLMNGKYSDRRLPNFEAFLKGHSGEDLRVDRVGRPSEYVREAAITMGLTVQPEVFRSVARNPSFRGRGLLARMLISCPASMVGTRDVKAPPVPPDVRLAYHTNVRRLLASAPSNLLDPTFVPKVLEFSPEAHDYLVDVAGHLEPRLGPDGDLAHLADWGGKLLGAIARIAGLLHLADQAGTYADAVPVRLIAMAPGVIPLATVVRAHAIGAYFVEHAKAAFAQTDSDPELVDARYLLKWVRRNGKARFTRREAFEGTKGRFHRVEQLEPVLMMLMDRHFVRLQTVLHRSEPGRPPSPVYEVNPEVLETPSHNSQNSLAVPAN